MANDKQYKRSLKVYIDGTEVENSVNGINREIRKLKGEMRNLTIGTEEYERKAKQLRELDGILQRHRRNIRNVGDEYQSLSARFGKFADGVNRYMGVVAGAVGAVTGLTMTVRKTVQDYAEMEDAMANVRKYTGQTDEEVRKMNEDLQKMDTRTPIEKLNELAGAAGRLGITATKDILEFVDGADKVGVALGDDLGEGAVDTIGKLAIAFGESDRLGLRGAMLATGSALNEIVASSSAQAQPVVEFTEKLSGVGQQAHITQAQIMGFASALNQNNQEMATSSTVMSQLITKMYQDPARFAKMAGMEVKKFKELIKTDMNQAIVDWLKHVNKLGDMSVLAGKFDELKMDGTRAVGVLATLAGHVDQVVEAQRVATEAYEEATSVIDEFNIQNTTVQAELDKARKKFGQLSRELGEKLMPIAKYGITTGSAMVKALSQIVNFTAKYSSVLIPLIASMGAYATVQAVVWANSKKQLVVDTAQKALHAVMATLTNARTVAVSAYGLAVNRLRGNTIAAARAQVTLNAAMSANVFGAIAAAAVALVVVIKEVYTELTKATAATKALSEAKKEVRQRMAEEQTEMERLVSVIKDANTSQMKRKEALELLNGKLMEKHLGNLTEEEIRTGKAERMLNAYNRTMELQIENEILLGKLKEARAKQMDAENGEFDMSFIDHARAAILALTTLRTQGFKSARNAYNNMLEGFRLQTVKDQEDAINAIKAQMKENDRKMNEIHAIGEVVVSPDKPGSPNNPDTSSLSDEERKKLEKEARQREAKEAKERREALAKIEAEYTEKQNALRKKYISGEIEDRNYLNEQIEQLELEKLNAMLGIANLEPKKRAEIAEKITNIQMDLRDKVENLMKGLGTTDEQRMQDELDTLQQKYEKEQSIIKQAYEQELMTKEEYMEADMKLTAKYDDDSRQVREKYAEMMLAAMDASHKKEILALDERRVRENMSEEKYEEELYRLRSMWISMALDQLELSEEKRAELQEEYMELQMDKQKKLKKIQEEMLKEKFSNMQNIAQSFGQAFGSAMEDIFAGEEDAIKHFLQTMINQVLDYLEKLLIASVAERTIKSIGTLGLAGIQKAAIEIGLITAAFETAKAAISSFDVGGFTGNGEWNEPRGVVHANEFVANRHALRNPSVMPVLSVIDQAQRTGTIANLSADDIAAVLPVRQTVSPIAPMVTTATPQYDNRELLAMLAAVNRTMGAVITRFKDPIIAETYATGKRGTIEAEGLVQRMRNNVTRQKH